VPWAQTPTYVPPPPTITLPPIGSSSPVAIGNDRQSGLAPYIAAKVAPSSETASLPRPGVDASLPGATAALGTAPKTIAPAGDAPLTTVVVPPTVAAAPAPETQPGPVAIKPGPPAADLVPLHAAATTGLAPAVPVTTANAPRLALSSPIQPALAKTEAPVGDVSTRTAGRTSLPVGRLDLVPAPAPVRTTRQASLAPMVVRPPQPTMTRVEPVGPTVATATTPAVAVQPTTTITPDKVGPATGLARTTVPKTPVTPKVTIAPKPAAPAGKVAVNVRPPAASLITDAALAEYRGLPVPAYRMTARLPDSGAASVPADGRITKPEGNIAAIPVAVAKVRDIKIVFDGEVLSLRATPETRRGISLAPLREIFEQTDGVLYWLPVEKQVRAVNKGVDMNLKIGDPKITVNGEQRVLQIAPYIKRGRTMVPLQFIADLLDVNIAVNSATGDIMISSNQL